MRVAVLGSWRQSKTETHQQYWALRDYDAFPKACFELGRLLADTAEMILVSNDQPDSVDSHVVNGVLTASERRPERPVIHVVPSSRAGKQAFEDLSRQHAGRIVTDPLSVGDTSAARLVAVRMADAVIVAGGTESAYEAGLISIINRKRLIPVGSFGGAAAKLLEKIAQSRSFGLHVPSSVPPDPDLTKLAGPWTSFKLDVIKGLLDIRSFLKLLIIYGRTNDWSLLKNHLQSRLKLPEPVVMREVFGAGRTLPEKFEHLATPVHAAIAVITPADQGNAVVADLGGPLGTEAEPLPRARQNVWLEIGWFWGALGRRRILLLTKGRVEIPSDLHGISHVEYREDPGAECAIQIEDFLKSLNSSGDA